MPDPTFGGILVPSTAWLADYDGCYGRASVDPDGELVPWTEYLTGSVAHSTTNGVFTMTDLLGASGLRYGMAVSTFDYEVGTVFDARVKVTASSGDPDTGAMIAIRDGEAQYVAWLRSDGVNIHGKADVAADMTGWRRVRFVTQGVDCNLYIDDNLRQIGYLTALDTTKDVQWGTKAGYGYATSSWDFARVRRMNAWDALTQEGSLVTIGPYTQTITDLAIGQARTVTLDHSAVQVFDMAEPPRVTDVAGNDWADNGVIFQFLCDSNGSQSVMLVTNESYNGYGYYYGGGDPDITFMWTRTGLVDV